MVSKLLVLACLIGVSLAYPSGAPESACESFQPSHNATGLTSPVPYNMEVTLSADKKTVDVHMYNTSITTFYEGFLIGAVVEGSTSAKGSFDAGTLFRRACSEKALTHKDKTKRYSVQTTWTAPEFEEETKICFRYTIVFHTAQWWGPNDGGCVSIPASSAPILGIQMSLLFGVVLFYMLGY